ncbi:hypothetical protein [Nonomuraea sp. NPDC050643]|uniref:hypothetical protein n=1 Tax=Nonomuraea sp. NPDC050643 TaxID=3155660 RepID=UPI00340C522F
MNIDVLTWEDDCPACGADGPYRWNGEELGCLSCGTPREVDPELIASVLGMEFCKWCREERPAGHTCRTEEPRCEDPTRLDRCGICRTDLDLQAMDLARREAEAARRRDASLYGPSDSDCPA